MSWSKSTDGAAAAPRGKAMLRAEASAMARRRMMSADSTRSARFREGFRVPGPGFQGAPDPGRLEMPMAYKKSAKCFRHAIRVPNSVRFEPTGIWIAMRDEFFGPAFAHASVVAGLGIGAKKRMRARRKALRVARGSRVRPRGCFPPCRHWRGPGGRGATRVTANGHEGGSTRPAPARLPDATWVGRVGSRRPRRTPAGWPPDRARATSPAHARRRAGCAAAMPR